MSRLTPKQLYFLKKHNVDLKYVFNANGMSKSEYRQIMKELNKYVAFNVIACRKSGHTLRTRTGHCIQCDTARLAFMKRHVSEGIIYIAGSKEGEIMKVGYSKAVEVRQESLNRTQYAGYKDWVILFAIVSEDAGKIESMANMTLRKYAYKLDYYHNGEWQDSSETYTCTFAKAKESVLKSCKAYSSNYKIELDYKVGLY